MAGGAYRERMLDTTPRISASPHVSKAFAMASALTSSGYRTAMLVQLLVIRCNAGRKVVTKFQKSVSMIIFFFVQVLLEVAASAPTALARTRVGRATFMTEIYW